MTETKNRDPRNNTPSTPVRKKAKMEETHEDARVCQCERKAVPCEIELGTRIVPTALSAGGETSPSMKQQETGGGHMGIQSCRRRTGSYHDTRTRVRCMAPAPD